MFDPELESFKTSIDLRAYAASEGYALDRNESWRGSAVMRHANGDKVIVKRDADGHYVYFSVRDDSDNGTIIDLVKNRRRMNLGEARKVLRRWTGHAVDTASYPPLPHTAKDRRGVETSFVKMAIAIDHPYLEQERALSRSLLQSARFIGRIRSDARVGLAFPNAVFPHYDRDGLCGYEIKNTGGFTGFAKGGSKGLWLSRRQPNDSQLVFCESAIDALSHATLFPAAGTRYASIGGKLNPQQPGLVLDEIMRMPQGSEIVAAMDADADGDSLDVVIEETLNLTRRSDLTFRIHRPVGFKDWNDQLRGRPIPSPLPPARGPSVT